MSTRHTANTAYIVPPLWIKSDQYCKKSRRNENKRKKKSKCSIPTT